MSKRFGRNQKRKMREQLQQAQSAAEYNAKQLQQLQDDTQSMRRHVGLIVRIVPEFSSLLESRGLAVQRCGDYFEVMSRPKLSGRVQDYREPTAAAYETLHLMVMRGSISIDRHLHARLSIGHNELGYSCTREHLYAVLDAGGHQYLADEIARVMVDAIKLEGTI